MQAFVFPGQGSQSRGMGARLFDTVTEYASIEREVDRLLGYSLRTLCLNGPDSELKKTQYTQPCLFVVNALYYYDALAKQQRPDAVAGHSLGEYNALMAAGAFDFLTGVRLVAKRGELMGRVQHGAMAAVLNLPSAEVARLIENSAFSALDVASYNTPLQTVVAGPADVLGQARALFEGQGALYVQLPVSAPFHSRYMADAATSFARFLETCSFNELAKPVVSNVTGEFYPQGNATATIRTLLVQQITRPVRWMHGVQYLRRCGVTSFHETGPGGVLTRMHHQIEQDLAKSLQSSLIDAPE